jgi:flavin reductase (DIM6/NTAB) family NADH-FMN oxidoreductase RutF/DNA-binding IclR family transcriptional regulator
MDAVAHQLDIARFREVLGHFPTGVAAITSLSEDGRPVGMAVGSFTSVSLTPPLVAFFPDKKSTSFPPMRSSGRFCVNVLSSTQETVCRSFAVRGGDKFEGVTWRRSPLGSPIIADAVAWIDCELYKIEEAGDHFIVLGLVHELGVETPTSPLLFFQGGYGGFTTTTQSMGATVEMISALRLADRVHDDMEMIARHAGAPCHAQALSGDHLLVVSSSYPPRSTPRPLIGVRFPLVPPSGELFMAWAPPDVAEAWIAQMVPFTDPASLDEVRESLVQIRSDGWGYLTRTAVDGDLDPVLNAIVTHGQTPAHERQLRQTISVSGARGCTADFDAMPAGAVKTASAPVLNPDGSMAIMLSIHDLAPELPHARAQESIAMLRKTATQLTGKLRDEALF